MASFTLYTDFDVRFETSSDGAAEEFARQVVAAFETACMALPRYQRQFTEVELRRGVRGKVLIHREEREE
jgi:hypothetical protein